ncbi:MAG: dihydropteroate synthase [Gemmatimonadaceae bacterium]|nr:dihydropteroate synthase [Gloeobacterales cyanobacterium ES-bin-141]
MTRIVGIVNITSDSFSDGGRFLEPEQAILHGRRLLAEGADLLDLGAESSNPDGQRVTAEIEIERLTPVIGALKASGACVAIDTFKPEVMAHCLALGADMINDITALGNPAAVEVLQTYRVPVVLMFARNNGPRATRQPGDAGTILMEVRDFFARRVEELLRGGLHEDQFILDPGMGYFLGSNPEPSLTVLRHLEQLQLGLPLYISVSRKSFIGHVLGGRGPDERAHGTLVAEIWACLAGVDYIRTHQVGPLHDAIRVLDAIQGAI